MFSLGLGSHEATFALGISIKLRPSLFSFGLRLKSQHIKSKESVPWIPLEFSAIQYLPLFLKFLLWDTIN